VGQGRWHLAVPGSGAKTVDQLHGSLHQGFIEGHWHLLFRLDEVDHTSVAGKAILPQHQPLGAELHPLRLVDALRDVGGISPLVVYRRHHAAFAFQEIDPAGYAALFAGEGDGSVVKCLEFGLLRFRYL